MNWGGIMIAVRREKINYQKINFGGKKNSFRKNLEFFSLLHPPATH